MGRMGLNGIDAMDAMDPMDPMDAMEGMEGMEGMDGMAGRNGMNGMDGAEGMNGMYGMDEMEGTYGWMGWMGRWEIWAGIRRIGWDEMMRTTDEQDLEVLACTSFRNVKGNKQSTPSSGVMMAYFPIFVSLPSVEGIAGLPVMAEIDDLHTGQIRGCTRYVSSQDAG